jgi:hypothetical protein
MRRLIFGPRLRELRRQSAEIAPGTGVIGTDDIRVAVIRKTAKVTWLARCR